MSKTLQSLRTQLVKGRNYCYYGKYIESIKQFSQIQTKIESQIFHISDKTLISEWNKLLQEIKYQKLLVQTTIQMLTGKIEIEIPMKKSQQSEKQMPPAAQLRHNVSKQQTYDRKPKLPFGKEPFKKRNHEDDEIYNRKQKQKRYQEQQEYRRDQQEEKYRNNNREDRYNHKQNKDKDNKQDDQVWDQIFPKQKPAPKPVAKKTTQNQSQNHIYNANKLDRNNSTVDNNSGTNNKNRQYEKPWKKNAKNNQKKQNKEDQKKSFLKACYPDGQGPDANLIEMMQRQVVETSPNITFDDIAELTKAKQILEQAVLLPLAMPDVFTGNRRAWKGVLLFGPPGTGKTLLAKAVASTGATTFFNVTASSLASKWRGQSQKMVRILFQMAKFYAPATIFIDEIDSLASSRGQKQDESSRRVKTEFMARIDGCTTGSQEDNKLITVIGATNRPWDLDEAIRRRLQKRIYIPLPTQLGRRQLLKINLKNQQVDQGVDLEEIVKNTDGYSGADIACLCREAAYMPMRRKLKSQGGLGKKLNDLNWKQQFKKDVNIPLTNEDFLQALRNVKPSVGKNDLEQYKQWMAEFGQQGTM